MFSGLLIQQIPAAIETVSKHPDSDPVFETVRTWLKEKKNSSKSFWKPFFSNETTNIFLFFPLANQQDFSDLSLHPEPCQLIC